MMTKDPDFISSQAFEFKRFYLDLNPSKDQAFTVVCGGVEQLQSDYLIERKTFPFFGVELVAEGTGGLVLAGQTFSLARGTVFAYGPGVPHRIENFSPEGMKKYFLDLAGSEVEEALIDAGLLQGRTLCIDAVAELEALWQSIDREAREGGEIAQELCELLSKILLIKLRQRRVTADHVTSSAYQSYESLRKYIEAHYLEVRTIREVADSCGVTPVYVSRLFKRFDSLGAYRFLMRLRMNHAADLLAHKNMKVSEVASLMGFADQFQFSRAFKREYGIPPTGLSRNSSS